MKTKLFSFVISFFFFTIFNGNALSDEYININPEINSAEINFNCNGCKHISYVVVDIGMDPTKWTWDILKSGDASPFEKISLSNLKSGHQYGIAYLWVFSDGRKSPEWKKTFQTQE